MPIQHTMIVLLIMALSACGGGGGGGGSNSQPTTSTSDQEPQPAGQSHIRANGQSLNIIWSSPSQRANGESLPSEQIQAYALIFLPYQRLKESDQSLPYHINNIDDFFSNDAQITKYINGTQLKQLLAEGNPYIKLIPAGTTSYQLNELSSDYYYLAIATVDTNLIYGQLSETVSVHLTP